MMPIQKYIWVVETIRRAGRITLKELNEKWRDNEDLSYGKDLPRQTFDRWKGSILDLFGIIIDCERGGLYRYYIANPKVLDSGDVQAGCITRTAHYARCQAIWRCMTAFLRKTFPLARYFSKRCLTR